MLGASAAAKEPTESASNVSTSILRLPTMSPIRPRIAAQIEAESRYAVSTQVTVFWSVSSSTWTWVRTGTTSDWSNENEETEMHNTAKVRILRSATAVTSSPGCRAQPVHVSRVGCHTA